MKLFLAQIEHEWKEPEPYEYEYGVSDIVLGKILVMHAKWKITGKKYTMQSLIDSISAYDVGAFYTLKEYWTNELRKPKDVLFCGAYISTQLDAIVMKWDYTDEFKERMKKRDERRDRKLKEELESIRQKKQKGGKK